MNEVDILSIHEKFSNIYDGYKLLGSYKLYIPNYKIDFIVEHLQDTRLNIIEEHICKCISIGINYFNDIGTVLSIDDDLLKFTLYNLKELEYIIEDDRHYSFTEESEVLFKEMIKRQPVKERVELYFDTLRGNFVINTIPDHEEDIYVSFEKIHRDEDGIVLSPRKMPFNNLEKYEDEVIQIIKLANTNINRIKNIELDDEKKKIYYHLILLLVYKCDNKYKIVAYDPCSINQIDNSITGIIQKLYDNGQLLEIVKEQNNLNVIDFNTILENYEEEFNFDSDGEAKNIIEEIREITKNTDTLEYIMNYKIREKFIHYLKNAKESLYIISPWMNNYIINSEFVENLERLLKQGVKIRIIYGISTKEDINEDYRNSKTDNIAKKLKMIGKPYGDLFKISHGQTHEKLLICDRKYYINGSFNFLSYSGQATGKFRNEGSTYSENKKLIEQTIKLRFNE
ncbi:MAG: phospholipase D-like domain-containing protein [Clostridium sp.]|uniref:phospholipase D-like domain-containing protein n=1 Tax=Clostridium sp. TaxID=1506 RepID=UPI0039E8D399